MKNRGLLTIAFLPAFLFLTAVGQDLNEGQPEKKREAHIKMIRIMDGEKTTIDTVLTGGEIEAFVWKGGRHFSWKGRDGVGVPDSLEKMLDFEITEENPGEQIIIMKKRAGAPMGMEHFNFDGDSAVKVFVKTRKGMEGNQEVMVWTDKEGEKRVMVHKPGAPRPPMPPMPPVPGRVKRPGGNVIDLSDPGIISYNRKKMSGGREKITIVRNEKPEMKEEKSEFRLYPEKGRMEPPMAPRHEMRIIREELKKPEAEEKE